MIRLRQGVEGDCEAILQIQRRSFAPMLAVYRDYESNPAAENLEQVEQRFHQNFSRYFLIEVEQRQIGFVRVCEFGSTCRVSPLCILPEYQRKGYGRLAMEELERQYPRAETWTLETIAQEEGLCRFYESLGYRPTGAAEHLQPGMDIQRYEKTVTI